MPAIERYLTTEEVAQILRVSPPALKMQRIRGQKPGVLGTRIGNRVLYRPSALSAYLESVEANPDQAA